MNKPFSQACENNKRAILAVLEKALARTTNVLEIGSGTGQHAVFMAEYLPHLRWQPSDVADNLPGINAWLAEARTDNINPPLVLDVNQLPWPLSPTDSVFSANTLHIIGKNEVVNFFKGVHKVLLPGGKLCVYGPFNYQGNFTSESNARFDTRLKQQDPKSGIRDFEWVNELAEKSALELVKDHAMPANNRLLEWRKVNQSR